MTGSSAGFRRWGWRRRLLARLTVLAMVAAFGVGIYLAATGYRH